MGLIAKVFGHDGNNKKRKKSNSYRICRIEEIEPRILLSVTPYSPPDPIDFGIIFHDDTCHVHEEQKNSVDTFSVSWKGGEDGTVLSQMVIDLSDANSYHSLFFEQGSFYCKTVGIKGSISQDGKTLTLTSNDSFTAGTLNFSASVYRKEPNGEVSLVTDGLMFEGATLEATFNVENFKDCVFSGDFLKKYTDPNSVGLRDLPKHDECFHEEETGNGETSAGVIMREQQEALTGTISGSVFHDRNNDGIKDTGEESIEGVELSLWVWDDAQNKYVPTAHKNTFTDKNGQYTFDDVEAFKVYQIREVQPEGYISGINSVGTMNGEEAGIVSKGIDDALEEIAMPSNGDGENYNFGEYKNASISGYVYEDANGNETFNKSDGEKGIADAMLSLWVWNEKTNEYIWYAQTKSNQNGYYEFTDLPPGTKYKIQIGHLASDSGWSVSLGTLSGVVQDKAASEILLSSGDQGTGYNFGTFLYGSIGGKVYEDADGNKNLSGGEKGIAGASVSLWVWDWDADLREYRYMSMGRTAVTDRDGNYHFESLEPFKKYQVKIDSPAYDSGWAGNVGSLDGTEAGNVIRDIELLMPDQHGKFYNFGTFQYGTISGKVYQDGNGDEDLDEGEKGISNASLSLWVWDSQSGKYVWHAQTKTDSTGYYEFNNLQPGTKYQIQVGHLPSDSGWSVSLGTLSGVVLDNAAGEIILSSGDRGSDYNFGTYQYGTISGKVYEDNNGNETFDTGERGITGVSLSLWVWDWDHASQSYQYINTGRMVTTDKDGNYLFESLEPFKKYQVKIESQAFDSGWKGNVGTLNGNEAKNILRDIDMLLPDQHGEYYNFGTFRYGTLSGHVYNDRNADESLDNEDEGIADASLSLWVWNEQTEKYVWYAQTVTDASGYYEFGELLPGRKYQIQIGHLPADSGWSVSLGTLDGITLENTARDIVLSSGQHGSDYDFGTYLYGSISGKVYDDDDGNGTLDEGEKGIADATLSLWVWDWDETLQEYRYFNTGKTTLSDRDGFYQFSSLAPFQKYQVLIESPAYDSGWAGNIGSLKGNVGENILRDIDMLLPDQHGKYYNFGTYQYGSISGKVEDDGGNPIPGSKVEIFDEDGNLIDTTTTDEDGNYEFTDLPPGSYWVRDERPDEYCGGSGSAGNLGGEYQEEDNSIRDVEITSGDDGVNYDFVVNRRGIISGFVYVDENKSGGRNIDEKGLGGVNLTLWAWDGTSYVQTSKTTVTDEDGYYEFNGLCSGKIYKIMVGECPDGYEEYEDDWLISAGTVDNKSVGDEQDSDDSIVEIVMPPNGHGKDYNFGKQEIEPDDPIPPPDKPTTPNDPPNIPDIPAYYRPSTPAAGGFLGAPGVPGWSPSQLGESLQSSFGGGGMSAASNAYTWHLSVVNAGYPRTNGSTDGIATSELDSNTTMILSGAETNTASDEARYISVAWNSMPKKQSGWYVRGKDGIVRKRFVFGADGGIPVVGDFSGDGIDNLAVYHHGSWHIDINGNGIWDNEDLLAQMGGASDQPVSGDWDGDGKADIGIFGAAWSGDSQILAEESGLPSDLNDTVASSPKNIPPDLTISTTSDNARVMRHSEGGGVRLDVVDHVFQYGSAGDKAFTGDFTGDGIATIGVYRDGKWYIDRTGSGKWDEQAVLVDNADFGLGKEGVPVIGDFTGDGIDKIGLYVNGIWHLDTTGDFKYDTKVEFGEAGDYPVVGDFDGTGIDQLAIYRASVSEAETTLFAESSALESAPMAAQARVAGAIANEYGGNQENVNQNSDVDQQSLKNHGRSVSTPHTNAPLHR